MPLSPYAQGQGHSHGSDYTGEKNCGMTGGGGEAEAQQGELEGT